MHQPFCRSWRAEGMKAWTPDLGLPTACWDFSLGRQSMKVNKPRAYLGRSWGDLAGLVSRLTHPVTLSSGTARPIRACTSVSSHSFTTVPRAASWLHGSTTHLQGFASGYLVNLREKAGSGWAAPGIVIEPDFTARLRDNCLPLYTTGSWLEHFSMNLNWEIVKPGVEGSVWWALRVSTAIRDFCPTSLARVVWFYKMLPFTRYTPAMLF